MREAGVLFFFRAVATDAVSAISRQHCRLNSQPNATAGVRPLWPFTSCALRITFEDGERVRMVIQASRVAHRMALFASVDTSLTLRGSVIVAQSFAAASAGQTSVWRVCIACAAAETSFWVSLANHVNCHDRYAYSNAGNPAAKALFCDPWPLFQRRRHRLPMCQQQDLPLFCRFADATRLELYL